MARLLRLVASNATEVVYGAHQVFTTGKKVAAWGYNSFGQADAPPGLTNVTSVAAGGAHSVALRAGGLVAAWETAITSAW
jgi:alpha-tubulin suppressor-like RCC1 family protein